MNNNPVNFVDPSGNVFLPLNDFQLDQQCFQGFSSVSGYEYGMQATYLGTPLGDGIYANDGFSISYYERSVTLTGGQVNLNAGVMSLPLSQTDLAFQGTPLFTQRLIEHGAVNAGGNLSPSQFVALGLPWVGLPVVAEIYAIGKMGYEGYRYVGAEEAQVIKDTGFIPNTKADGVTVNQRLKMYQKSARKVYHRLRAIHSLLGRG